MYSPSLIKAAQAAMAKSRAMKAARKFEQYQQARARLEAALLSDQVCPNEVARASAAYHRANLEVAA